MESEATEDVKLKTFNRKPATFVGYGNAGGARAVEQLRSMLVELQVAPLRGAVHLSREQSIGILFDGKTPSSRPARRC